MRLESKNEKLAALPHFFLRLFKYSMFSMILISVSLGIGTFGYCHFANLGLMDSFHMSCMILTGMGPVVQLTTTEGKLFSSFYALYSGVAFLSISAVFFSPIVHRLLHLFQVDMDEVDNKTKK